MTPSELMQLERVADLRYQQTYKEVQPLLEAEQRISAELSALDAHSRQKSDDKMNMVGADQAWMAWTDARRRQLLSELANARARRLAVMDRVTRAFGRLEGCRVLSKAAQHRFKKQAESERVRRLMGS